MNICLLKHRHLFLELSNLNAFINRIIPFMFLGCDAEGFLSDCQNLRTSPPKFSGLQRMLPMWGKTRSVNSFKKRACLISGNTKALGQR